MVEANPEIFPQKNSNVQLLPYVGGVKFIPFIPGLPS